jgi:hypothetical protein
MILFHPRGQYHHANYKTATVKLGIIWRMFIILSVSISVAYIHIQTKTRPNADGTWLLATPGAKRASNSQDSKSSD